MEKENDKKVPESMVSKYNEEDGIKKGFGKERKKLIKTKN